MGLLGGGLIYTPPVPALSRYEPTGTWMIVAENHVAFSRDGINWLSAEFIASTFWDAVAQWVYATGKMVIPASDIFTAAFRMTSSNPVLFTISVPGPNPGANDEFAPAFRLSHGTGGFSATSTGVIRSSGDAEDWAEELPVPGNFANAGLGIQRFMPEVSLHIRLGAGEFPATPSSYWTSGNGTGWTERTFPEPFDAGIMTVTAVMAGNTVDVIVVGLASNGRIYRSLDGVTWSLRFDPFPEQSVTDIIWNPMANDGAGAFFCTQVGAPDFGNLLTSADGIFWNPVDPNDLTGNFHLAADTSKNLMIARGGGQSGGSSTPDFEMGGYFISDDDGETWAEFSDRIGGFLGFIPAKIGPVVVETLNIDTGAIVIAESVVDPNVARASLILSAFSDLESCSVREQTIGGGQVSLGKWANTIDELNPAYHECRLDRTSGDDFTFGTSAINAWIDFSASWGWLLNAGVDVKTFTGTLRVRHKETLVESNSVSVQMDAEVTA